MIQTPSLFGENPSRPTKQRRLATCDYRKLFIGFVIKIDLVIGAFVHDEESLVWLI